MYYGCASSEFRGDKEIVLEAIKQNGFLLGCASEELRGDKEVVLEAIKQDGYFLELASDELLRDREMIAIANEQKEQQKQKKGRNLDEKTGLISKIEQAQQEGKILDDQIEKAKAKTREEK